MVNERKDRPMALATAAQPDPSPPIPTRAFWWFWGFSLVGAPIAAVLGVYLLAGAGVALAGFTVAAVAAAVYWRIPRVTPITPTMALCGFVTAVLATGLWAFVGVMALLYIYCGHGQECFG
jgi:hypothetical protein